MISATHRHTYTRAAAGWDVHSVEGQAGREALCIGTCDLPPSKCLQDIL